MNKEFKVKIINKQHLEYVLKEIKRVSGLELRINDCDRSGATMVYANKDSLVWNRSEPTHGCRHLSFKTLDDLLQMPDKVEYEEVTWYRVAAHPKYDSRPDDSGLMYRSKEDFLDTNKESDYHFIKLEKVITHKYKEGEL